jgi:hypothetical protein
MNRRLNSKLLLVHGTAIVLACAAFPTLAQTPQDDWQFTALVYGYAATLNGSATFPTGTTANLTVDPNKLIEGLNFAFMGSFEAQKGHWGLFTDFMYIDASGSKSATRDLSIAGVVLPAGVSAEASLDVRAIIWTLAGSYRFVSIPEATFDVLVGARELDLDQHLSWQFSSDVGPFVGPARQGSGASNPTDWDGIIGVKGRLMFGEQHQWFLPYYLDVGTGQSQLTWQGIGGIGYSFHWGEVIGVWRYLDYHFSKDGARLAMNGPAIGVAFHW